MPYAHGRDVHVDSVGIDYVCTNIDLSINSICEYLPHVLHLLLFS